MRGYESNTAARALNLHRKTFDNLLQRFNLSDSAGTQGKRRFFTISELLDLDLAVSLWRLGLPARRVAGLSSELLRDGQVELAPGLVVRADAQVLREDLLKRLISASETVVVRPRGRPRRA